MFLASPSGCPQCRTPKTRVRFWTEKLEGNKRRDTQTKRKLTQLGWSYLVIWECETKDMERLANRIEGFLDDESG
jgi:DNA mismatch endonuclease (patch repair protein)